MDAHDRIRRLARRLKEEAESLADYETIAGRTVELGFPTAVRTIRFYVDQGILPPPLRTGKTPVFEERWVLGALLAIYVMKTRLGRGLGEVRTVMENLNEPSESLAEKCMALHEGYVKGGRLARVETEYLLDRFFGLLTGDRDGIVRQASEIDIEKIVGEIQAGGGWRKDRSGRTRWHSPDEANDLEGFGFHYGRAAAANPAPSANPGPDDRAAPHGAIAPEEAKRREGVFIRGFENGFKALRSVRNPLDGRTLSVRSSARDPVISDEYLRVVEVMKSKGIFDRDLFERLPLNKATEFHHPRKAAAGGGKPRLIVVGACLSPIAELVVKGWATRALGARELREAIDRWVTDPEIFYYLGLFTTTGWDPRVFRHPPEGANYRAALVEYRGVMGWHVVHGFGPGAEDLARVFDPETVEEKTARCYTYASGRSELKVPGGFVPVSEIEKELGIRGDLLEKVLSMVTASDAGLKVIAVKGKRILKRERG